MKISRFQIGFLDFSGISVRFQDFKWDFWISSGISGESADICMDVAVISSNIIDAKIDIHA